MPLAWRWLVCIAMFLGATRLAGATPFIPARDDIVLERLPQALIGAARELKDLAARRQAAPHDAEVALALAARYIELARAETDPRLYGQAEGVLQSLWQQAQPSAQSFVLRAIVLQARHDFAAALSDLHNALTRDPRNAQAWLTQAAIQRVQGEYPAATQSCGRLARLVEPLVFTTCLAAVRALDGHSANAFEVLEHALSDTPSATPGVQQWALTMQAEIAVARGEQAAAERAFKAAVAVPSRSVYLLLDYADFLLDADRAPEVLVLLGDETRVDGALLRAAEAARRSGSPALSRLQAELAARVAASRLRGDTLHQGDAARYALWFERDARTALSLALANWTRQREPRDARIVLEAAQAGGQPAAAQPVMDFLRTRGTEDVQLQRAMHALPVRN